MGAFSRSKGKRGELELAHIIADLTGWEVKRRVRQHDGDSDLEGIPGWCVESKNCATLKIPEWWEQTVTQAQKRMEAPVLFYKVARKGWQAMWPVSVLIGEEIWADRTYTVTSSIEAWAAVASAIHMDVVEESMEQRKYMDKLGIHQC